MPDIDRTSFKKYIICYDLLIKQRNRSDARIFDAIVYILLLLGVIVRTLRTVHPEIEIMRSCRKWKQLCLSFYYCIVFGAELSDIDGQMF